MGHDAEQSRAVLRTLGERRADGRLEEAVSAYRAALLQWTRDKVPLQWAMTQDNFGAALLTLGERESGTARLEEAVEAHGAALQEGRANKVPLDWAETRHDLGNARRGLGQREAATDQTKGCATLKMAQEHYAAAWRNFGGRARLLCGDRARQC